MELGQQFKRSDNIPENVTVWNYEPLYKDSANGSKMMWKIGINNVYIIINHGHVGGVIQEEKIIVELNKSGRFFS